MGDGTRSRDPERALQLAYAYLNRRERTEAELRAHLEAKGLDAAVAETAVGALRDDGYIDDVRFARLFTEDKRHLDEWGNGRIRRALLDRGVDRELVDETLSQTAHGDELERARTLLRRRFPSLSLDRRDRERALGVLLRKGFDSDLALEAVAEHGGDPLA